MKQWHPLNPQHMNATDLPIAARVRQAMARQDLYVDDVLLVLSNSGARLHGHKLHFRFDYLDQSPASTWRREIGESAGLERVEVVVNHEDGQVIGVRRRNGPSSQWTPAFRLNVTPEGLRLTRHAKKRLRQRHLTREDLVFVIRHGSFLQRTGQVHYTITGYEPHEVTTETWQRLTGVVVVVCTATCRVITAWRSDEPLPDRQPPDTQPPDGRWRPSTH